MKTRLISIAFFLIFLACNDSPRTDYDTSSETEETIEDNNGNTDNALIGAWELTSYYNYQDDEVIDSFNIREGFRQVKIYSPTKVMWSKKVPLDSTEWFGYGTYRIEDGQLVEVLDYGSRMMSQIIDEREEFRFDLDVSENAFSQIEIDEDGQKVYAENYKRIE